MYQLKGVRRRYLRGPNEVEALGELDLTIQEGESIAVVGPSGSGKTTLLHILGLLDPDYEGELIFRSASLRHATPNQRAQQRLSGIGFVFQGFHLLGELNLRDNVALPHWRLHGDRRRARERAESLLARVGLQHRAEADARHLSTGEQQRAAVARALVNEPSVVLADEPTGNLDADNAALVLDLFAGLTAEGVTLVLVTHNDAVAAAARRRITLRHGRLQS